MTATQVELETLTNKHYLHWTMTTTAVVVPRFPERALFEVHKTFFFFSFSFFSIGKIFNDERFFLLAETALVDEQSQ